MKLSGVKMGRGNDVIFLGCCIGLQNDARRLDVGSRVGLWRIRLACVHRFLLFSAGCCAPKARLAHRREKRWVFRRGLGIYFLFLVGGGLRAAGAFGAAGGRWWRGAIEFGF